MKKIMFNTKLGLTQAVLDGRKTQTRRIVTCPKRYKGVDVAGFYAYRRPYDRVIVDLCMYDEDEIPIDEGQILPKYKVGEIVAIAQSYKDIGFDIRQYKRPEDAGYGYLCGMGHDEIPMKLPVKGYSNKMFVNAELMPHQIRITNVRIERLQDISDDDCLAEGIIKWDAGQGDIPFYSYKNSKKNDFDNPRDAFAALIDKIGKKGDWDSNPYVFVYDFELVK